MKTEISDTKITVHSSEEAAALYMPLLRQILEPLPESPETSIASAELLAEFKEIMQL